MLTTEHFIWSVYTPGTRHRKYECNIWHWFGQSCSALVLLHVASTLAIRTRSKLNRCETTSRRWFSLIRLKSLMRISWCSVNARMGAKPVSLRIKSASVNGVIDSVLLYRDTFWSKPETQSSIVKEHCNKEEEDEENMPQTIARANDTQIWLSMLIPPISSYWRG